MRGDVRERKRLREIFQKMGYLREVVTVGRRRGRASETRFMIIGSCAIFIHA